MIHFLCYQGLSYGPFEVLVKCVESANSRAEKLAARAINTEILAETNVNFPVNAFGKCFFMNSNHPRFIAGFIT